MKTMGYLFVLFIIIIIMVILAIPIGAMAANNIRLGTIESKLKNLTLPDDYKIVETKSVCASSTVAETALPLCAPHLFG